MNNSTLLRKLASSFGAVALLVGLVGCGDDDDGFECGPGTEEVNGVCQVIDGPDAAAVIDAAVEIDAAIDADLRPVDTRNGFIAVADVTLLGSSIGPGVPDFRGGSVLISYDLRPEALAPVYDDRDDQNQGCAVWAYNLNNNETPPVETDEGTVTITGTGVEKPLGVCAYSSAIEDYSCVVRAAALAVDAVFTPNGDAGAGTSFTETITVPGETFGVDDIGQYISLTGFTEPLFNGAFPIVKVSAIDASLDDDQVVVFKPMLLGPGAEEALTVAGTYAILGGVGPTPAGQLALDDGTGDVNIVKAASSEVEAIDETLSAGGYDSTLGQSWTLADGSDDPSDLDLTGTDPVTFTCDEDDNGVCGSATVMAVFGETSTGEPDDLDKYGMPESTDGIVVSFLCAQLGADTVVIPTEAMAWIRGTGPTKVKTTVLRGNLTQVGNADGTNGTNIMVGYGLAGITQ